MTPTLLNATELGKHLGLTYHGVISLWEKGAIPAEIAEGRIYRFDLAKVKAALAKRAQEAAGV